VAARFTLYGSPHSLFTYKVALMLALSGTAFSFRYVSFQRKMHREPAFLARSRWGQVPVLVDGARTLVQSAAMLEYLAAATGRFAAPDEASGQEVREWLCWDADRLTPPAFNAYGARLGELKLLPLIFDPAVIAHFRRAGEEAWNALDRHLGPRDFIAATRPTIADIACYGALAFAEMGQIDLAPFPHVVAWSRRIAALPGFALPLDLLPMADAEIVP
jgi:glutathione S-transferase